MAREAHITDEELTLWIDGELERTRIEPVQEHLAHCWACRQRRGELERAVAGFLLWHQTTQEMPAAEGPAARLRAQLARLNTPRGEAARTDWTGGRWALICLACLSVPLVFTWRTGPQHLSARGPLPDARLTPGATRFISREEVCAVAAGDERHQIQPELARSVFARYGMPDPKPGTYEVDYLVSPSLGGADDVRNLWPQRYDEGVWTSRIKDALEDQLRLMVCAGRLELTAAQWELSTNWIAAYKKHFRTSGPIEAHALFVKDRPWE